MARSYLFPGQDVEHLSPEQRMLERLYDQIDRPGNRITPQQFFKSPEYGQFVDQQYGSLSAQVPPGSQIVKQDPFQITYRDADGYETTISRGDAQSPGTVTTQSNRPAILPNQRQNTLTGTLGQGVGNLANQQLANLQAQARGENVAAFNPGIQADLDRIRALSARLENPATLAQLDPQTAAALNQIRDNALAQLNQQFQSQQGDLLARLFGQGVNRSSVATGAAGNLLRQQGLVTGQALSDAAQRELAVRQYLSDAGRQNLQTALAGLSTAAQGGLEGFKASNAASGQQNQQLLALLSDLTNQQNARDIAGAGLSLDAKKLQESQRQFDLSNILQGLQVQNQQEQIDTARGPLAKALGISQIVGNLTGAVGSGISAYDALTKRRQNANGS